MRFVDWFAGIGGFREGMEQAGHECVGFCEYDKYAYMSYVSMHLLTDKQREYIASIPKLTDRQKEIMKPEYRNGEWYAKDIKEVKSKDVPEADCWCFGAPCFVAGTLIMTKRGYIPIENVLVGDVVLTHEGNWKKVTDTGYKYSNDIYILSVYGIKSEIRCTGNHRFYVRERTSDPFWEQVKDFNSYVAIKIVDETMYTPDLCHRDKNNVIWACVRSAKKDNSNKTVKVYNLTVQDDNSYCVYGLAAHNCQDFSIAGKREGLSGDRSSLIRQIFRLLEERKEEDRPEWLIYENVKGMLSSNVGLDYLSILSEMERGGTILNGRISTQNGFCPKTESVSTLSDILEDTVEDKYYLSREQMERIVWTSMDERN